MATATRIASTGKSGAMQLIEGGLNREIGYRIRDARLLTNRKAESVAKEIGMSAAALGNIERGQAPIRAYTVVLLAQALKTPLSYFFDGLGKTVMADPARLRDDDPDGKNLLAMADVSRAMIRIKDETVRAMLRRLIIQLAQNFENTQNKDKAP